MARNLGNAVQNHFGAGLVTEATGLNFPPNAATYTDNCIFTHKMSVKRRPGINFEANHQVTTTTNSLPGYATREYLWEGAGGFGSTNLLVTQRGDQITFWLTSGSTTVSNNRLATTINLDAFKTSGAPPTGTQVCDFAAGYGYLFICHPYCDPFYIGYDPISGAFTSAVLILEQRDFAGATDPYPINTRPAAANISSLGVAYLYNKYNQGWGAANPSSLDYLDGFHTAASLWPSDSDYWWAYKDSTGVYNPTTTYANVQVGNSPAPKGHFIVPCFFQDQIAAFNAEFPGIISPGSLPVVNAGNNRPSVVAFYAGRVFYAGVGNKSYTNQIFYSQVIRGPDQMAKCYQDNDPTASDTGVTDLLATDGGVLVEPEIGQIYKMYPIGYSLIIFASNGIWAISGSTGTGFSATDFSVSKVSTVGMLNPLSFIDLEGSPVWWNNDSIYTLGGSQQTSPGGQSTGVSVSSVSDQTIKTLFDSISPQSKLYAKGSYNKRLYTMYWLYSSQQIVPSLVGNYYQYDSVLCFNTLTKACYTYSIAGYQVDKAPLIAGIITMPGVGTASDGSAIAMSAVTKLAIITVQNDISINSITFAEFWDESFQDFGNPFKSKAIAGYALGGGGVGKFQTPYLEFYLSALEASAISVYPQWNFANNNSTGKIGIPQILQVEGGGMYDYKNFKRKLRGEGIAMQVTFESVDNQPFEVAGWAVEASSNTQA